MRTFRLFAHNSLNALRHSLCMFAVFRSAAFERELERMPNEFVRWANKVEDQLRINHYRGRPLRVPWFREMKRGKFRIYYLVYEEFQIVYLVGLSEKRDQQRVIDAIWLFLDTYREEILSLLR